MDSIRVRFASDRIPRCRHAKLSRFGFALGTWFVHVRLLDIIE